LLTDQKRRTCNHIDVFKRTSCQKPFKESPDKDNSTKVGKINLE